ncbi:hypothetical protein BJY00DRAFT_301945 [Aspergillus carlsbadensis]|nr:hypothetical protein BJY00DRAFT_301945 [Aspergillus carlsbadensis]
MTKYVEGQYNTLTFDDNSEVVAQLPNPNAGPPHFDDRQRSRDDGICIPIPRILDWSCDPSNPVGSEYIIMEKARGTQLGSCWYELSSSTKYEFIKQVFELEAKLASFPFPAHGCIYHKRDLPSKYSDGQVSFAGDDTQDFCIGPVVDSVFWPNVRSKLDLSRGPWYDLSGYATSLADNEKRWMNRYAQPRINYYRSYTEPETPSEYIDLVEKYLHVATSITESQPDAHDILQPTLWHSDLHLNNIYVDLATEAITDIIDWQNTTTAPLILQSKIPRMTRHVSALPLGWNMPEKPADYDNLAKDAKAKADELHKSALCHKYYEVVTAKKNPRHYAALTHNAGWKAPYIRPLEAIGGAWADKEVFRLRQTLMEVVDNWSEIHSQNKCPIHFTPEEIALHKEEVENREYVEKLMEEFQNAGILLIDGVVDPEDYEILQRRNAVQKARFLSLAESEEERAWMDKIWPYQDPPKES